MLEMHQIAELRTIYPEQTDLAYENLLKGISKDTLYKVATYLLGQNLYSGLPINTQDILANWFSENNKDFLDTIKARIKDYEGANGIKLTIVSTIGALKILQHGLEFEENGKLNEKTKEQSEIDLFIAMLAINQIEDQYHTNSGDIITEIFPQQ